MELGGFCRAWRRAWFRRLFVLVVVAAAIAIVANGTRRALVGSSEFMGFRRIVQVSLVENDNHYEQIGHIRAYPPFFPIFWSPFGAFPVGLVPDPDAPLSQRTRWQQVQLGISALIALIIMSGLTVWAAWLAADSFGVGGPERAFCLFALVYLLSVALMHNSLVRCETDMFVVVLVAGGMYMLLREQRNWEAGALLGVAAALKLTPGLFALYFLCRRRWRAFGGMAAAGLICWLVLPLSVWGARGTVERYRGWTEHVLLPIAEEGPDFIARAYRGTNQSLRAALVRYLSRYNAGTRAKPAYVNVAQLPEPTLSVIVNGARAVVLGSLVLVWVRAPRNRGELEAALFGLVPPGMLLLSDVSVGGHFAIALVPLAVLCAHALRHEGTSAARRVSWGVVTTVVLMHLIAFGPLKRLSAATFGALVLYGTLYSLALHLSRRRPMEKVTNCPAQ